MRAALVIALGLAGLPSCASRSSSAPLRPSPAPAVAQPPRVEPASPVEPVGAVEPARAIEPAPTMTEPREPNPYIAPLRRQGGDLTVEAGPTATTSYASTTSKGTSAGAWHCTSYCRRPNTSRCRTTS
jgi:hypothetical protein